MTDQVQKPSRTGASGLAFVGCLLIGLAIGLLSGEIAAALLGALGIGFLVMAILRAITGQW